MCTSTSAGGLPAICCSSVAQQWSCLIRLEEVARKQREREAELEEKKRLEREAIISGAARASPAPSPEKPSETPGGGGGGYVPPTRRGAGGGHAHLIRAASWSLHLQSWICTVRREVRSHQPAAEQIALVQGMCLQRGGPRMRRRLPPQLHLWRGTPSVLRNLPRCLRAPTGGARAGRAPQKRPAARPPLKHPGRTGQPRQPLPAAASSPGDEPLMGGSCAGSWSHKAFTVHACWVVF